MHKRKLDLDLADFNTLVFSLQLYLKEKIGGLGLDDRSIKRFLDLYNNVWDEREVLREQTNEAICSEQSHSGMPF